MNYHFPISSERINYLPLSKEDAHEWTAFFIDNPMLNYLGISSPGKPEEEARQWIERQLKRYVENGWGHLKMVNKETGDLIGNTGLLLRMIEGEALLEIGYSIIPKYWGQGYASEAAQRMKAYMKANDLHTKAVSMIHADNIGSQKVAEKNGLSRGRQWEYMGMPVFIYEGLL